MYKRDIALYLADIEESITAIESFTAEIDLIFSTPIGKPIRRL